MLFPPRAQDDVRIALSELQQALSHHEQWCENLNKTLICAGVPDERDLQEDAHRRCRFGQWLYGAGAGGVGFDPGLARIETVHKLLHVRARNLLSAASEGRLIAFEDYESFSTVLKELRLEVLTAKHELEEAILNLDPLTGVANRLSMMAEVRKQHSLVSRNLHCACIAMIDLDHFKSVNDNYGHAMGDEVLRQSARCWTSKMRPYDALFRYGGEEFLLCAPSADIGQGLAMVERLREGLAELEFEGRTHPPIKVTASCGLTMLDADVPVEQSIERADKALYAAKAAGRNRTMIWDASAM
jgi:diguanylate cyclase